VKYDDLKALFEPLRNLELSAEEHRQMRAVLHRAMTAMPPLTQSWRGQKRHRFHRRFRTFAFVAGISAAFVVGIGIAMENGLLHPPTPVTGSQSLPEPDFSKAVSVPWSGLPVQLRVTARAVAGMYGSHDTPEDTFRNVNPVVQKSGSVNDSSAVVYVIALPGSFEQKAPDGTDTLHASKLVFNMSADGKNVWDLRAIDSTTGNVVWTQPHLYIETAHNTFSGQGKHWTGQYETFRAAASPSKGNFEQYGTYSEGTGTLRFLGDPASIHGPITIEYQVLGTSRIAGGRMELPPVGVVHFRDTFSESSEGILVTVKWNGQGEQFTMRPNK
jgi:hypothetical protein